MDNIVIQEEIVEYKVYKEKPYLNSDREPFGLTINGKTKEYIHAHETFRSLIKKGKLYMVEGSKIKILDITNNKGSLNAILEVSGDGVAKGNVELKVYNPSVGKKKGATIELRKMSGFDYILVEKLKMMITNLLDGFIAGYDVEQVLAISKKGTLHRVIGKVTSKPKLFACDLCNWQTKFGSALKSHKTRIHCKEQTGRKFKCDACVFQFDTQELLDVHGRIKHKPGNKRSIETPSPSSSPPRKRQDGPIVIDEFDESEVEMMDLDIEAKDLINRMLENRINELEKIVEELQEQKKQEIIVQTKLQVQMDQLKSNQSNLLKEKIPKHLFGVPEKHLPFLRGYRMGYKAVPNGACLQNCVAVHVYEDQDEGAKLKKRLNNHVADNWLYYKDKIALPYVETVGVGEYAKVVEIDTEKEMIEFLKSDEALMVYSNSQELLAIANFFNMNISIFTYGGGEEMWNEVKPDPEFVADAEIKFGKWIPDMALYHSHEMHYDLLVKDDSRLALLGLLAGMSNDECVNNHEIDDWEVVTNKKRNKGCTNNEDEKLLSDNKADNDDAKDFGEEITLLRGKNSGSRRTAPQECSQNVTKTKEVFPCNQCDYELESSGLLEAHMIIHQKSSINQSCESCDKEFANDSDLNEHMREEHVQNSRADEWNCNDCSFQGNCASELVKHLKLTGHVPSKHELDNRKIFKDFKQCYSCKMEFDGYWNLMTHRKNIHPSNKRCRNFPGNCKFGKECWYVHEEGMETDQLPEKEKEDNISDFKCNLCDKNFKEKSDFMMHRKTQHTRSNQRCEKYLNNQCERSADNCWYVHSSDQAKEKSSTVSQEQVFCQAPSDPFPPDQMSRMFWMVSNLCRKVEGMEKRFEELMI